VVILAAWILAHYGYLFAELYPSLPILNSVIKQVSTLAAMLCLLHLITISFETELTKKWTQRTFSYLKAFTALLIVFYLVHMTTGFASGHIALINIFWNVTLLISVCFVITVLAILIRTSRTARLFCTAISLVSLMAIVQSISNMGWLYNYHLNEHGMLVASLLEMLLLTFGIFYNLWEEKTQREEQLKITEEERAKTLQTLITVQDEERKRIASDLHDSIGPMLAAIKINFRRMAKAKMETVVSEALVIKTEAIIDDSLTEIRNISHRLMPKGLSSKGLLTLLSDYFTDLETVYSIRINFTHEITMALENEIQLNLYRMISELSLNAAKHSEAKWLCVSIKTYQTETMIEIKDDGTGFTRGAKNVSSLGLKNVQSRVEYLGGKMKMESTPDKGTTIEISIPHGQEL
jgi:signal transduction histidine kinase